MAPRCHVLVNTRTRKLYRQVQLLSFHVRRSGQRRIQLVLFVCFARLHQVPLDFFSNGKPYETMKGELSPGANYAQSFDTVCWIPFSSTFSVIRLTPTVKNVPIASGINFLKLIVTGVSAFMVEDS